MMKKNLLLFLKIIITGGILTFLFFRIPVEKITESLKSVNLIFIVFSLSLYLIYIYLSSFETRYLTKVQGISLSTLQILKINLATMFYNLFLPGLITGGAVKWYKFSKFGRKSDAAAVVAFNRILETLMTIFTGIVFSLPVVVFREQEQLFVFLSILLLLVLVIYVLLLNQRFVSVLEKILLKIPFPQLIKSGIKKFFVSIIKFKKLTLKENFQIFGLLFIYHTIGVASSYMLALALNLNITFFDIAWMRASVNILTMLPFSFAGLGIREVTLIYLLGNYGVDAGTAMAFSLLIFFNLTIVSLSGGVIEFFNFLSGKKNTDDQDSKPQNVT